jgi:hypothetical protein
MMTFAARRRRIRCTERENVQAEQGRMKAGTRRERPARPVSTIDLQPASAMG